MAVTVSTNTHVRWVSGVHCTVLESHKVDAESKTRGPSSYRIRVGSTAAGIVLDGAWLTEDEAVRAAFDYVLDHQIPPTLACRAGKLNTKRTVKLRPEDIELLERILARERGRK